jgi:hypothetical protein
MEQMRREIGHRSGGRRGAVALVLLALVSVACGGGNDEPEDASPAPFPTNLVMGPPVLTEGSAKKAAPRWEKLEEFSGTGSRETPPFAVATDAIQWRVKWRCESGRLRIEIVPPPSKKGPLVDSDCPKEDADFSVHTGERRLAIQASGRWTAIVEQQVDTPINEPPLAGMEPSRILASGSFYSVEKNGKGTVQLYRLPSGQLALRFSDDFEVFNDPDLAVWVSELEQPKTSAEIVQGPHVEISPLKATRGPQNYVLPRDLPPSRVRSVALYCVPVPSIYIAAVLET